MENPITSFFSNKKTVSIIITWDVDEGHRFRLGNNYTLGIVWRILQKLELPSTFFFPAIVAEGLRCEIGALLREGHEIGCHGLTHSSQEEYNIMSADMQWQYLEQATSRLSTITERPIRSFRAPRVKVNHVTHQILESLEYFSDSSVSSQRLDFVSSNLINLGWIIAPRRPYHPDLQSAFRRGSRKIWVVPISALGLPFISSTLYVFGLELMKLFFKVLYNESLYTGKPIVYLAHPYEFAAKMPWLGKIITKRKIDLPLFQRIRTHGFLFRKAFYNQDVYDRIQLTQRLFSYMAQQPNVKFQTMQNYVSSLSRI